MPKVSVVLPTYNGEQFLAQSIESVINQTFQDWELIIVNDCSTDSTLQIAEKYAKKDSRIQVVSNEVNKKLPESLNVGFRLAKGEYLTWTSDDNYYMPEALKRMNDYLDHNQNFVMVCAKIKFVDEHEHELDIHMKYDHAAMFVNDCVGACFMYRREVLETVGEYDTDYFCVEDYEYWLRILEKYDQIAYIDQLLYIYRMQPNGLTMSKRNKVRAQLSKLRIDKFDFILSRLKGQYRYIVMLYCEFCRMNSLSAKIKERLLENYSNLQYICDVKSNVPIILYGSGKEGEKALNKYGDRVSFFADGNKEKVGKYKKDKEIISVEEMFEKSKNYQIVVSVGDGLKYELMENLLKYGLKEFSFFLE